MIGDSIPALAVARLSPEQPGEFVLYVKAADCRDVEHPGGSAALPKANDASRTVLYVSLAS
jgi:hypothetical protein